MTTAIDIDLEGDTDNVGRRFRWLSACPDGLSAIAMGQAAVTPFQAWDDLPRENPLYRSLRCLRC